MPSTPSPPKNAQTTSQIQAIAANRENALANRHRTKKGADPTNARRARCLRPCKISGLDRTKMFHVNHFGTIALRGAAGTMPRGVANIQQGMSARNALSLLLGFVPSRLRGPESPRMTIRRRRKPTRLQALALRATRQRRSA
jgi:hypothetical protein